jgi:hypothetical protein
VTFFLGLDLGQAQDPTAIAVLERSEIKVPPEDPAPLQFRMPEGGVPSTHWPRSRPTSNRQQYTFDLRHLERLKLGTPYPAVVSHVQELLEKEPLKNATELVVDATGVGRPVVDFMVQQGLEPVAITITGGDAVVADSGGWRVPKRDVIAAVQVLLENEHLRLAARIPALPALAQELRDYRVKIDPLTAHDSYNARAGAHDDLVLALAVAAWYGQRYEAPRRRMGLKSGSFYVGW